LGLKKKKKRRIKMGPEKTPTPIGGKIRREGGGVKKDVVV